MILQIFKYYLKFLIIYIVLSTSVLSQKKVACIGNSITFGSFLANPSVESYPAQLQQKLGNQFIVYNYGSPGKIVLNGFSASYINSAQFLLSISQYHDIIIIVLGTNDTNPQFHYAIDNFINDYKLLINAYNNFPGQDTPIYILGIPPPYFNDKINDYLLTAIIPRINTVANYTNYSTANFYNALKDKEYLFIDGIHPNVQGAEIMAKVAKQTIDKILNPAPETPTNFSAIGEDKQIILTWDTNTEPDLANYNIYRGVVDGGWKDLLVSLDKNNTFHIDAELDNYTTYYYQISAVNNSNNESLRTSQISATPGGIPDVIPPATPINLTAISKDGFVELNWTPNTESDLANYHIYRGIIDNGWKDYLANIDKNNSSFVDTDINVNTTYFYQISAQDNSGNNSDRTNQISATTLMVVKNKTTTEYLLYQNSPNPFNPYTIIEYSMPIYCYVTVTIYDLMGNEVKLLINDYQQLGHHSIIWDGTDNSGNTVCCGTYLYQINTDNFTQTRKMVLLK